MKRIENLRHLEEYGIIPLTGESDAHMYRILCDVTQQGNAVNYFYIASARWFFSRSLCCLVAVMMFGLPA